MARVLDVESKPGGRRARRPKASSRAKGVIVGALLAALGVTAVLVVTLSQSAPRLAGVDKTRVDAFSTVLEPGARVCQAGEVVPADAGSVSLVLGLFGGNPQPLAITLT